MLDQDNNFYLISLSILITFSLDTVCCPVTGQQSNAFELAEGGDVEASNRLMYNVVNWYL